jgi:hypothetical protein
MLRAFYQVPFRAGNDYQTFKKIQTLEFEIPLGFPEKAKVRKYAARVPPAMFDSMAKADDDPRAPLFTGPCPTPAGARS